MENILGGREKWNFNASRRLSFNTVENVEKVDTWDKKEQ